MPNATTFNRILSKGIESELPKVVDGRLRFTTDTGRLFLDNGNERVEISDFVKGQTSTQITGTLAPLPKFYLASDTNVLYFYAGGQWNTVKAANASTADYSNNASTANYAKNAINTITRSGNTFTATRFDGTTFTFSQQNSTYTNGEGLSLSNGTFSINKNASTVAYATKAGSASSATNATNAGSATNAGTADYASTAANGIENITRSGKNFTVTRQDGSTFTFDQQDDNQTYKAGEGLSLNTGTFSINKDASTVKYATQAGSAANATCATNSSSVNGFTVGVSVPANAKFTDTTYAAFSTASNGLVKASGSGGAAKFLKGDNTWGTPTDTKYAAGSGLALNSGTFSIDGTASTVAYATNAGSADNATCATNSSSVGGFTVGKSVPSNAVFTDTTYATFSTAANGLVPKPTNATTTQFLRGNGTWATPTNTTYANATTAAAGLLPTLAGGTTKYLRADGSWQVPPDNNTTYDLSNYVNTITTSGTGDFLTGVIKTGNGATLSKGSLTKAQVTTALGYTPPTSDTTYADMTTAEYDTGTSTTTRVLSPKRLKEIFGLATASSATNASTAEYAINAGSAANASSVGGFTVGKSVPSNAVFTDTTYSAASGGGLSLSGTAFSINKDASTVKYATSAGSATNANNATCATNASSVSGFTVGVSVPANAKFTDTTYAVVSTTANGLAPKVTDTSKFLKGDGTWATPTNTTYTNATTAAAGLLPILAGGTEKYLRADGTWVKPPNDNTTYGNMTSAAAGLAPAGGSGTTKYLRQDGSWQVPPNDNTKNTAGSTDTSSKIFLVGATSQAANPQTYSHDTAYVGTDGCLYSGGIKVLTAETDPTVPSWAKASSKPTYTASEVGALSTAVKGAVNGVAELDSAGKVPSSQLPSYVDDVIEGYYYNSKFYKESAHTTEITPESGKIYVDLSTDKTYRWSGTAYTQIKGDLALGETSTTAYRGDRGKIAYDHSQAAHAPSNAQPNQNAFSNVKVSSTTIAADTTTDTLEIIASGGITLTPDATNDKLTISSTTYGNMTSAAAGLAPAGGSGTTKYLRQDGSWQVPPNDNTTYANVTSATAGLAPAGGSGTTKYLRQDGSWQVPPDNNTTYGNMTSAAAGLAPAGGSGTTKYLRQDGTWQVPPNDNTTYAVVSTTANGLAPKVTSTSGFLKGDGTWATPTNTTYAVVSTTANGLAPKVTDTSKFLKGDGTWATPANTTYGNMTSAAAGLAPAGGSGTTKYLRQDGSWQVPPNDNTTYGNMTSAAAGLAPAGGSGTTKYLRQDGSWQVPPNDNTTYGTFSTAANGLVPKPASAATTSYLNSSGTWTTPVGTTYSAGTGISISTAKAISLATTGTAGTYGPSANVTGNEGATISVPQITTDSYGRVTSVTNRTYTSKNTTYDLSAATVNTSTYSNRPMVEADFDFGELNSTTPGDESYNS